MKREQIKELALARGFKLKPQPDGSEDLNPYVYEFAQALIAQSVTTTNTTAAAEWREAGKDDPHGNRYDCERAALALGGLTDDQLANAVFTHDHRDLDIGAVLAGEPSSIGLLTAAKDRIRWLSRSLIKSEQERDRLKVLNENLGETLFHVAEMLGIEYDEARKHPGKPSDVYRESLAAHDSEVIEPIHQKLLAAQRATSDIAQAVLVEEAADMCLRLSQQAKEAQS